jgi:hypothetical protein
LWRVWKGEYDLINWGENSGEKSSSEVNYIDILDVNWIKERKGK